MKNIIEKINSTLRNVNLLEESSPGEFITKLLLNSNLQYLRNGLPEFVEYISHEESIIVRITEMDLREILIRGNQAIVNHFFDNSIPLQYILFEKQDEPEIDSIGNSYSVYKLVGKENHFSVNNNLRN